MSFATSFLAAVLTTTFRDNPSDPEGHSVTTPKGHTSRGAASSTRRTTSPTARPRWRGNHFERCCSAAIYSVRNRFHRASQYGRIVSFDLRNSEPVRGVGGRTELGRTIAPGHKNDMGVNGMKSFGSSEQRVNGRRFIMPAATANSVRNWSMYTVPLMSDCRILLSDLISLSHTPPR